MPPRTSKSSELPQYTQPCASFNALNAEFAAQREQVAHLEEYERKQNGSIARLADGQDTLRADLNRSRIEQRDELARGREERRKQLEELEARLMKLLFEWQNGTITKFDTYNARQQTLMGGMIASLFLLAANLAVTILRGG